MDPLPRFLAHVYSLNHPTMATNNNPYQGFSSGTVNGAAWYQVFGGMQVGAGRADVGSQGLNQHLGSAHMQGVSGTCHQAAQHWCMHAFKSWSAQHLHAAILPSTHILA